jgi:NADPH:quinone reductase-like Zn-dependent oxidoreductase/acyl carrier protein
MSYDLLNNDWILHVLGKVTALDKPLAASNLKKQEIQTRCKQHYDKIQILDGIFPKLDLTLGKHFRWIEELWVGEGELLAKMRAPQDNELQYELHPGFIDSCFQATIGFDIDIATLAIPLTIASYEVNLGQDKPQWIHIKATRDLQGMRADLTLYNDSGVVAEVKSFVTRTVPKAAIRKLLGKDESLSRLYYQVNLEEMPLSDSIIEPGNCLIRGDIASDLATLLNNKLIAAGNVIEHGATSEVYKAIYYICAEENTTEDMQQEIISLSRFLQSNPSSPIYLITHFQQNGAVTGLHRTLSLECPDLQLIHIEIETNQDLDDLIRETHTNEREVTYKDHKRYVPRLATLKSGGLLMLPQNGPYRVSKGAEAQIEALTIEEITPSKTLGNRQIEIEMKSAALNFRDVLNVLGLYPGDAGMVGGEGAGVVLRVGSATNNIKIGDIVYGMIPGAFGNYAICDERLTACKPASLTMTEAATLPIAFMTSYSCLISLAKLKAGEKLLIHTASGGVGLAALQVAKLIGADVYVTAGTASKRAYLSELAAEYNIKGIYDSRNLTFADEILKDIGGIDVVLNTLTSPGFIEATLKCCKQNARFTEISKRDIWTETQMGEYRADIEYHVIAIDNLGYERPDDFYDLLQIVNNFVAKGDFKALPTTIYPLTKTIAALNYLRKVQHIGKIVLEVPERTTLCKPDASYLITGGLGGLGLGLAKYLSEHGAQHINLISRSKPTEAASSTLQLLHEKGVTITSYQLDIADKAEVSKLITQLNQKDRPLKGIFHLAGILDDGIFAEQTPERFVKTFAPKARGAWNLHEATKDLRLDHFVLFSSIAGSFGSPGQSNYAAANSALSQLAQYRQSQNLPALSVDWGPWGSVGMAANLEARHASAGMIALKPELGFKALAEAMTSCLTNVIVADINWKLFSSSLGSSPFFANLITQDESDSSLITSLENAAPDARENILRDYIRSLVKQILRLRNSDEISDDTGFFDIGMDSLMAVECRNRLQKAIGGKYALSNTVVFDYPNIEALVVKIRIILGENIVKDYKNMEIDQVLKQSIILSDPDLSADIQKMFLDMTMKD